MKCQNKYNQTKHKHTMEYNYHNLYRDKRTRKVKGMIHVRVELVMVTSLVLFGVYEHVSGKW